MNVTHSQRKRLSKSSSNIGSSERGYFSSVSLGFLTKTFPLKVLTQNTEVYFTAIYETLTELRKKKV